MIYSQQFLDIMELADSGNGTKAAIYDLISQLNSAQQAASTKAATAAKSRSSLRDVEVQIAEKDKSTALCQAEFDAVQLEGQRIARAIFNLQEAFSERGENPPTEDLEAFNAEIASLQSEQSENQRDQAKREADIKQSQKEAKELELQKAGIEKRLKDNEAAHQIAVWSLLNEAAALSETLDQETSARLDLILPTKDGSNDYLIEGNTGLEVKPKVFKAALKSEQPKNDDAQHVQVRLNKVELENRVQKLLDHMTSYRIAEERDADTYVSRLKTAFQNVEKEARKQEGVMRKGSISASSNAIARFECLQTVARHLHKNIVDKTPVPETPQPEQYGKTDKEIRDRVAQTAVFADKSTEFATRLAGFLARAGEMLDNLRSQFCNQNMVEGATRQSISVSRAAEIQTLYRILPLLWASANTLLVKLVLARNAVLFFHEYATVILVLTFLTTWVISIFIGRNNRYRRMLRLQRATRENFEKLTGSRKEISEGWVCRSITLLRNWIVNVIGNPIDEGKTIQFPPKALRDGLKDDSPAPEILPFDAASSLWQEKIGVFWRNGALALLPAILYFVVLNSQPPKLYKTYVSVRKDGQPCVLSTGRLIAANGQSYYLQAVPDRTIPHTEPHTEPGFFTLAFHTAFPEILSKTIARNRVIDILSTDDDVPSQKCSEETRMAAFDFDDLDNVFPADFRAEILSAQRVLDDIIVKGNVSASAQHNFLELLRSIKAQLGPDVTDEHVVRLITSGRSTAPNNTVIDGDQDIIIQNLPAVFDSNSEVATAIAKLSEALQSRPADAGNLDQLNADGLQEFAKLLGIVVQSNTELTKGINSKPQPVQPPQTVPSVVPIINEGAVISLQAPQNQQAVVVAPTVNIAPTPQTTSIVTNFSVAGAAKSAHHIQNTLFMPFFPDPVEKEEIETPIEAFAYGLSNKGFKPPRMSSDPDDKRDYFTILTKLLKSCLASDQDLRMVIDVQGHASSTWDAAVPALYTKQDFNHHLAEGRRMGALMRLKQALADSNAKDKIMVVGRDRTMPLTSFIPVTKDDSEPVLRAAFEDRRFTLPEDLEEAQSKWLSDFPLSNDGTKNNFEELFARTLIVEIREFDGVSCVF